MSPPANSVCDFNPLVYHTQLPALVLHWLFDLSNFISSSPLTTSFGLCSMLHPDVFEKSQALLVDELSRCSLLGLNLYNFHPGSSLGSITTEQCVEKIAGAINHAHQQTPVVVTGTGGGQNNTKTQYYAVAPQSISF